MTTGILSVSLPGRPDPVVIDPVHCRWFVDRALLGACTFYHYDERAGTWEIVIPLDRRGH